jgi:hypothetical protein
MHSPSVDNKKNNDNILLIIIIIIMFRLFTILVSMLFL